MTKPLALAISAATLLSLSSCLGMQAQSTLEAIQGEINGAPVVEAYIEYGGPQDKWAGPTTFLLHVVAKDSGMAQIAVKPPLFNEKKTTPIERKEQGRVLASKGISCDLAREHLATLATALESGGDGVYRGCMYPVHARLVRADGSLIEKQGCRGGTGWSQVASETVNTFITAALYGVASTPSPSPAPLSAVPAQ